MIKIILDIIIRIIDYPNKLKILFFFKKKLRKKALNIIDIGAHKGETIDFFLKNFNINKIISFEPNYELYQNLKKKYLNKKISIFNCGVGLNNEEKELNILVDSASSTFNEINTNTKYFKRKEKFLLLGNNNTFFLGSQKVKVVNLSKFILEKEKVIDVLKIDTEGFEFNILKGIEKKDFEKINYIYFEHHYDLMIKKQYKFSDINHLLKKNDFHQKLKIKMKLRKSFEYIYALEK